MSSDETVRAVYVAEGLVVPRNGRPYDGVEDTVDVLVTIWTDGSVDVALRPGPGTHGVKTWGPRTTAEHRPA